MRSFDDLTDRIVPDGHTPFGPRFWRASGGAGSDILMFGEPALAASFAALHEEAHDWIQGDYDFDTWRVLDVSPVVEQGLDFVIIARITGIRFHRFVPGMPDSPDKLLESPQVPVLRDTLAGFLPTARTAHEKIIARLIARTVDTASPTLFLDEEWNIFETANLEPIPDDLRAWPATD